MASLWDIDDDLPEPPQYSYYPSSGYFVSFVLVHFGPYQELESIVSSLDHSTSQTHRKRYVGFCVDHPLIPARDQKVMKYKLVPLQCGPPHPDPDEFIDEEMFYPISPASSSSSRRPVQVKGKGIPERWGPCYLATHTTLEGWYPRGEERMWPSCINASQASLVSKPSIPNTRRGRTRASRMNPLTLNEEGDTPLDFASMLTQPLANDETLPLILDPINFWEDVQIMSRQSKSSQDMPIPAPQPHPLPPSSDTIPPPSPSKRLLPNFGNPFSRLSSQQPPTKSLFKPFSKMKREERMDVITKQFGQSPPDSVLHYLKENNFR
ncbi:hypothetical protein DL96DRAFT_1571553 [Flagelloscypha sp. PMI_526]|nr:hypothetical protein DL96DRAFT_1571553 [Flagelloscypha sp. PMI_526]